MKRSILLEYETVIVLLLLALGIGSALTAVFMGSPRLGIMAIVFLLIVFVALEQRCEREFIKPMSEEGAE